MSTALIHRHRLSPAGSILRAFARPWQTAAAAALSLAVTGALLSGCGGGAEDSATVARDAASQVALDVNTATPLARPTIAAIAPVTVGAPPDPGLLLLLVPDGYSPSDSRISAWSDAAVETGVRLAPISDTAFAALGPDALKFAGLVLPDDIHSIASDATIAAVRNYVAQGGNAMLTFDFGALTLNGAGQPVFPIPKSRLSDVAGVDYILYDELRDLTTGIGPVTAMSSMLRELLVAPGKSMPYAGGTGSAPALAVRASTMTAAPIVRAANYLPVSVDDPGGVHNYDPGQYHRVATPSLADRKAGKMRKSMEMDYGRSIKAAAPAGVTQTHPARATPAPARRALIGEASADTAILSSAATDQLEAYSGYIYGVLSYPSYVTRGAFDGQALATSPQFGLVAGLRSYGAGKVLFVNLPLTYLKGRTDALPMHGFLGYFARDVLQLAQLAGMPNDVPGMVLNWHFDSIEAQAPALALESAGVFRRGPFSVHITAGPDAAVPGDGEGWNLDHNPTAQNLLLRLQSNGHVIGNHGGWNHDYYGLNANEFNQTLFEPYLAMNKSSVERVIRRATREYAAPEGNNPTWAMSWLERNGNVAAYFGGHTGLGVTRQYRDGVLQTPKLWVDPVTPQGLYATFEEFQDFGIPKSAVTAWYHDLVDFSVKYRTNRMVYMHPPGAYAWQDVLTDLLSYAGSKGTANFRWYTMSRLADFMAKRQQVAWSETVQSDGTTRFDVSSPVALTEMVWRLPKSKFQRPAATTGISVTDGISHWRVRATVSTTTLTFSAAPAL